MIQKTTNITELGIEINTMYDPNYYNDKQINYKNHYQCIVNNKRLMAVYFDLETALIASITYSCTRSTATTIELTDAIRNILQIPMRELKGIFDIDGEKQTDGECIDAAYKHFNLTDYNREDMQ